MLLVVVLTNSASTIFPEPLVGGVEIPGIEGLDQVKVT